MIRTWVSMCLPVLLLAAAGCGSRGTITGTITYRGKPIPAGSVMFIPQDGGPVVNAIINDGKYTAEKVPVGPAKVAVSSLYNPGGQESSAAKMMQGAPADAPIPEGARKYFSGGGAPKKGLKIPDKYSDLQNSGLTYTVTGGKQTKDFDLE